MLKHWMRGALVAGLTMFSFTAAQAGDIAVRYLGNTGFFLSGGGTKVIADGLFASGDKYPALDPGSQLLEQMELGQEPFKNVNLLLISHVHDDHFSAIATARFLMHHPKTVLVTTPEVRDALKKVSADFPRYEGRVLAPTLAWKQSAVVDAQGLAVEVAAVKHTNGKDPCQDYIFLFDMAGKKVLYASGTDGHFPEEYETLGLAKKNIDLAFLHAGFVFKRPPTPGTPFLVNDGNIKVMKDLIAPKHVVLMHLLPRDEPMVDATLEDAKKAVPNFTLLRRRMASAEF